MRTARDLIFSDRVLLIAHRGDSRVAPENTLPAFRSAIRVGVDFVELDYVHSADEVPIVIHDATLDRTTNARTLWPGTEKIPVASKSLDELRTLDAGTWFHEKFADARLSTLAEAVEVIAAGACLMIERKAGDADACLRVLHERSAIDRVVVQAFDWAFIERCRAISPDVVLGALGDKQATTEKLDQAQKLGAAVVGWDAKTLDAATIAAIHARGMKAWAWTVDDPDRARELIAAGLDGLISNVPATMKPIVAEANGSRAR